MKVNVANVIQIFHMEAKQFSFFVVLQVEKTRSQINVLSTGYSEDRFLFQNLCTCISTGGFLVIPNYNTAYKSLYMTFIRFDEVKQIY